MRGDLLVYEFPAGEGEQLFANVFYSFPHLFNRQSVATPAHFLQYVPLPLEKQLNFLCFVVVFLYSS